MNLSEDLSLFTADFGDEFTHPIIPAFNAIFKDKHASLDYEYGMSSFSPQITVPSNIANLMAVDEVITRTETGISYTLSDFQPDGTGMTVIRLFEA